MSLLIHNLKIAVRNLMKYKLQTVISVLSIAIGIVTLAFVHGAIERVKLPSLYYQSYYDRSYQIWFDSLNRAPDADANWTRVNKEIVRALKRDGGLRFAEKLAVPNGVTYGNKMEFHFPDSTTQKMQVDYTVIDPELLAFHGFRSAITGEKVKKLGVGEAVICKNMATILFGDKNPIGVVQTYTNGSLPIPFKIVDVCEDFSEFDSPLNSRNMYISFGDAEGDKCGSDCDDYATWVHVVLKEGYTETQLLDEINSRIKPLGLKANLRRDADKDDVKNCLLINFLVYLVGSLILVAAVIGFLRMQIQLFWSRRREVSLRIVNGATRRNLFGLFMTEILITISMAVFMAMLMGKWVENFLYTYLSEIVNEGGFAFHDLSLYCLQTGVLLLVICSIIIWGALVHICKAEQGLAVNMQRSRTHIFSNIMLGIQIAISILFVCGTFITLSWADKMLSTFHLPDDESLYKECIVLNIGTCESPKQIIKEIKQLPDVDRVICHSMGHFEVINVSESPDAMEALQGRNYIPFFCATDTSLLSFYKIQAHWFSKSVNINECVILNEKQYNTFKELGIIDNGTLTMPGWSGGEKTLPIAGTIPHIPYTSMDVSLFIHPDNESSGTEYVVVPKPGKYSALMRDVEETINRIEPSITDKMAKNFVEDKVEIGLTKSMRTVALILGLVAIIMCAMSIYSTIALDTRSRKKEVAIRKVHGALSGDIYRLFGHIYIVLIILSLLIAIPGALLFNIMMNEILPNSVEGTLTPTIPCILGSLIVIILITLIVSWHIRKVMKVECAELIARE